MGFIGFNRRLTRDPFRRSAMSFEYMPVNDFYITILLIEIKQYLRDVSLQGITTYHDRITDCVMVKY